jgi:tRNA (cmo5U34)-methyltransferase
VNVARQASTASDYFGGMVASYDSLIRRAVPRYEEMTARLVDYLPAAAARVLELGCGTGNLSLALAARYPSSAITFVDASREMVDVTRARLEAASPASARRARFLVARFEDLALEPASFDLVASCISLHHVIDKAALFRKLAVAIEPGGALRFSDQFAGSSEPIHTLNWTRWLEICREPGRCSEDEVKSLLDHAAAHDHYTPLADHFRLLEAAGFRDLDCVWRDWIWGIVTAER